MPTCFLFSASGAGGGDPARPGRPIPPAAGGAGGGDPARPGRPIPPAAGGAGGCPLMVVLHIVNAPYWNIVLSTSNDNQARNSTRFFRKRKLAKFFRVNDNLQNFYG